MPARPARTLASLPAVLFAVALAAPAGAAEPTRLLRFPDVHGDRVAFVYAGDIWVASTEGGPARRLTSHEGQELFPKFSPDGEQIAFSAEYSGNRQVWVIDSRGGTPRQLTYYNDVGPMPPRGGYDYRVLDWTPDGSAILVRANRLPWGVRMGRHVLVPAAGGTETPLEIPEGGAGMFSPDGRKLVYTPIDREFRTWKHYQGGRAQDVWIYDLDRHAARRLTDFPGTDNQPMWIGDTIYFTSDRSYTLNLFSYALDSGRIEQVTHHTDYDVLWPSAGPRRIVYQSGGRLWLFEPEAGSTRALDIVVPGDRPLVLPRFVDVSDRIESFDLSPRAKRLMFVARGEIWSVPAKHGEVRNLSRTEGVRERAATWSPDGRAIAYYSDQGGEYDLYVRDKDPAAAPRALTHDDAVWKFDPVWSPDATKIAFGDKNQRLRWVDVATGEITVADHSERNDITDYRFSPDGRYLVYTKVEPSQMASIWLYALDDGRTVRLTDETTNDWNPVFDPKGRYLYFLSDRDYNLTFSGYEFNYVYERPTRVYAAALTEDGPALLRPKSDEVEPRDVGDGEGASEEGEEKRSRADGDEGDGSGEIAIDVEGFAERVVALPGPSGDYRQLTATEAGPLFLFSDDATRTELRRLSLAEEKVETIMEGISAYTLSADGRSFAFRARSGRWGIAEIRPGLKASEGLVDLGGMELEIDPRAEWRQIFTDAWRILRDWFYDPNMHGVDWPAIRAKYEPLVEHVAHRGDLDFILGEMAGELNAGHVYVNRGDEPRVRRIDTGLLGAEIVPHASGTFRIAKIFRGENWHERFRSPLTMPGVDVDEGDFILAVEGVSARGVANFYSLLENTAGRAITIRVNDRPDEEGAHDETVVPIARETDLRYLDWVRSRRELVDRLSGGRIGYIHLPNTAIDGNRELRKGFFAQAHKPALIFDVRYNGGGFIPDRMIELVQRRLLHYWVRRGLLPQPVPGFVHVGPKACLINGYSSSGGDAFPYYFRKLGLGPLIGTRTWGGLIGLSGNPGLVDGGSISVPTFRFLDTSGAWDVENVGVAPDIEVIDRPDLVAAGRDPTLEKAVEVLLEMLERSPPPEVTVPPAPTDFRIPPGTDGDASGR